MDKLKEFWKKTEPARKRLKVLWKWAYKMRTTLLAFPVVIGALVLAIQNLAKLPDQVVIDLVGLGGSVLVLAKGVAVLFPLGLTALCLAMMFCSRRVVYPWLISVFSLLLPLVFLLTNAFPA